MGMAASQARFLGLTARKSNNEYQVQQLNQQRLNLADNQTQLTLDYQKKMSNRMLLFSFDDDLSRVNKQLTYWNIVDPIDTQDSEGHIVGKGYRVVDVNGNIVVPNYPGNSGDTEIGAAINKYSVHEEVLDNDTLYKNLQNGTWVLKAKRTDDEGHDNWFEIPLDEATFIQKMRAENPADSRDTEYYKLYNTMLEKVDGKYQELTFANLTTMENLEIRIYEGIEEPENAKIIVPEIPDNDRTIYFGKYTVDEHCIDPAYLEEKLRNGDWLIQKPSSVSDPTDEEWMTIPWQGETWIKDVYNSQDDAEAEAEYEYLLAKFQKEDKMLQLRLQQLETEHKALETELDSISKVIEKNVESSFKTFA